MVDNALIFLLAHLHSSYSSYANMPFPKEFIMKALFTYNIQVKNKSKSFWGL